MGEVGAGERAYAMVSKALAMGYRHFDTAACYGPSRCAGTYPPLIRARRH
jgi:diketogulonate reductase-like aldo/keto reductase